MVSLSLPFFPEWRSGMGCRRWHLAVAVGLGLFVAIPSSPAYDNSYQPGDSWMLEESFLLNKEGPGRFQQGDPKPTYNADDPIWYYLEALPGDPLSQATPIAFSGYHRIGFGWGSEQAQPADQEPPRIEGYPYIVRGSGSAETTIYVHPGAKDLVIAWQAPVAGRFKAEGTFERGGEAGDGQRLFWVTGDKVLAEADVPAKDGSTELASPEVTLKKGERLAFRINARDSQNDDSGVAYVQVTYLGP